MVGYFSISPSNMHTKIRKGMDVLYNKINKPDLIDIYRKIHLTTAEYMFFSNVHGNFSTYTTYWVIKQVVTNFKDINLTKYVRIYMLKITKR